MVGAFGFEGGPFGEVAGQAGAGVVVYGLEGGPGAGECEGLGEVGADGGVDGEGVEGVHLGLLEEGGGLENGEGWGCLLERCWWRR